MKISNYWLNGLFSLTLFGLVACGGASEQTAESEETPTETTSADEGWVTMFTTDTKDGWTQLNGQANYEIKDGVVIGTTKAGEPNSFLATEKMYDDFILEYEVMVDTALNSGVQIRSGQYEKDSTYMAKNGEGEMVERKREKGRVRGYQIEIDPSPRAYSGGVYDEARRGWLQDLSENEAAQNAFKRDDWNKFRVEAMGDTIRTYVNGVSAAEVVDDMDASGFIALQVHSIRTDDTLKVMWRNIRIKEM
ncbi:3-keto-disaccharide hydrolase [Tunicatimonas pelagia]|uniref:3-keto-disaccharide hydrolase n=1 Tax=Tunicatimonas pelagia TaxID=931531 RepID=UPI0026663E84|nr:DUF1080 domain-containing protein [Tunicatimonas pelagia]WKN40755.1 DUF1080 domain-containing protein [Tunicatimonas pelagia]